MKLSIIQLIYVPVLTCGHNSEKKMAAAKINFLHLVGGLLQHFVCPKVEHTSSCLSLPGEKLQSEIVS